MAKAKRKRLPKKFETLLEQNDLNALTALFDTYDVNAREGASKQTALAFHQCPDELAKWMVEHGADLAVEDSWGDSPLHCRSRHWSSRVKVLLELGADVHLGENMRGTPLHAAAGAYNATTAATLLSYGARVDALNRDGQTPLEYVLLRCSNAQIQGMAGLAELLLAAGARKTPEMQTSIKRIGTSFEFHRSGFNRDSVEATSAALDKLYLTFGVSPVPRRIRHDGTSPIVARTHTWQDQHQELWQLLVPAKGAADNVQGEVIRISGRIHDEIAGNGGGNWDRDYRKMADAFLVHIIAANALPEPLLAVAHEIVAELKHKSGDTSRLCEFAVNWVALNPVPIKLPPPNYNR